MKNHRQSAAETDSTEKSFMHIITTFTQPKLHRNTSQLKQPLENYLHKVSLDNEHI